MIIKDLGPFVSILRNFYHGRCQGTPITRASCFAEAVRTRAAMRSLPRSSYQKRGGKFGETKSSCESAFRRVRLHLTFHCTRLPRTCCTKRFHCFTSATELNFKIAPQEFIRLPPTSLAGRANGASERPAAFSRVGLPRCFLSLVFFHSSLELFKVCACSMEPPLSE